MVGWLVGWLVGQCFVCAGVRLLCYSVILLFVCFIALLFVCVSASLLVGLCVSIIAHGWLQQMLSNTRTTGQHVWYNTHPVASAINCCILHSLTPGLCCYSCCCYCCCFFTATSTATTTAAATAVAVAATATATAAAAATPADPGTVLRGATLTLGVRMEMQHTIFSYKFSAKS